MVGKPAYKDIDWQGNKIEGLLLNSRMVQGKFDVLNLPHGKVNLKYPDTKMGMSIGIPKIY